MLRRAILVIAALAALLLIAGSLTLWIVFASWLPTTGKTHLIEALERQGTVTASIGGLHYQPLRGFILDDVQIVERSSQTIWLTAPSMTVQVAWIPLASKLLVFRASATVTAPCHTDARVAGRYDLRRKTLTLDLRTDQFSIKMLSSAAARRLPEALTEGALRLKIHTKFQPEEQPFIEGQVIGTGLVWSTPTVRANGTVTFDGRLIRSTLEPSRWQPHGRVLVRKGTVEGLPTIGTIRKVEGKARLLDDRLDIEELTGVILESPWKLEGNLTSFSNPTIDVLLTSKVSLAPAIEPFSSLTGQWRPEGSAEVRAICRGPLQPTPLLDCFAHGDIRNATLSGPTLIAPLTHINASLNYDWLGRHLFIERLEAHLTNELLTARGELSMTEEPMLALKVEGRLPLEAAIPWLPQSSPVTGLDGTAVIDLSLDGPIASLRPTGRIELEHAAADVAFLPKAIEEINGLVLLQEAQLDLRQLSLTILGYPLTITATLVPGEIPRVVATIITPQGQLWIVSRITPEQILIDESQVTLNKSRLQAHGAISRQVDAPSQLTLSGAIELSELNRLPFFSLPQVDEWQLHGITQIDARIQGRRSDIASADLRATIHADEISVRGVPIEQLTGEIERHANGLSVQIPSGRVAEGKLTGTFSRDRRLDGPESFSLQADIVDLRLEKLAHAIPAWRERNVMGSCSSHMTLSGLWGQRAAWMGKGWLNASGERFADIPLLDKLFRGIFGVLADRLGLDTLRRAEITQAAIQWELARERISTQNLRLGGFAGSEPIAIYATGSVGLDQTLDFIVEPELSEGLLLDAPTISGFAGTVLRAAGQLERLRQLVGRHRLTGTIKNPEYHFEFSMQEIIKQLAPGPVGFIQDLFGSSPSR